MDIAAIQKRIEQIENLTQENKISRGMIRAELENDTTFDEVCDEYKAVADKRKRLRDEILSKAENQQLLAEIKENNEELNTLRDILSVELAQLYQEEQTDEIEDRSGEKRKFKLVARLLPKRGAQGRDQEGKYAPKEGKAN